MRLLDGDVAADRDASSAALTSARRAAGAADLDVSVDVVAATACRRAEPGARRHARVRGGDGRRPAGRARDPATGPRRRSTTATTWTPAGPTSACRSSAGRGAWSRRSSAGLDVRLSSVVARVEHGRRRRHGAARGRRGGRRRSAAVVALPLNVWRDVAFDPPLGGGKARGPRGRAIRADRRRSSPSPATCPTGSPAAAGEPRSTRSCRWATSQVGASSQASRRCSCSTLPTVAAVTDAVRAFIADAEVVAHGGHDWNADRFSRGVWFAEPPGWQRHDRAARTSRRRSAALPSRAATSRGPVRAGSRAPSRAAAGRPRRVRELLA